MFMNSTSRFVLEIFMAAGLPPALLGQTNVAPSPATPADPGLLNGWLRQQSDSFQPWDLGGQFRLRFEDKQFFATPGEPGAVDFASMGNPENSYWLVRQKLHLGYTPCPWVTAFVEGRHSSSTGDDREPNPDSDGPIDLHQAFVSLGNAREFPLVAKVGRQEMVYGDERLIGNSDWSNIPRVFDVAKLRYDVPEFWVDVFSGRVILPDDNNFNVPNDYDWFSGVYASTRTLIPNQESQVYVLSRNTGVDSPFANAGAAPQAGGPSGRDIYTLGVRVKSLPGAYGGWDYGAELAGQLGSINIGGLRLDQRAFASHVEGGYTWKSVYATPRLGLEYNYASGDSDPTDGTNEAFDNLFPTNHKFYGLMDFFSWQNIHDARLSASVQPIKKLAVNLDYHAFWLADTSDSFYMVTGARRGPNGPTAAGYGRNPGYDSYVGSEIDLVATYTIRPQAALQFGYGHFFIGDYVHQSLDKAGGSEDANWIYGQLVFGF